MPKYLNDLGSHESFEFSTEAQAHEFGRASGCAYRITDDPIFKESVRRGMVEVKLGTGQASEVKS